MTRWFYKLSLSVLNGQLELVMNIDLFIQKLDQGRICGQMQNVSTGIGKSSYYSAQNSLNAIVFKLQVILLMMEVSEKSKNNYYSLSY